MSFNDVPPPPPPPQDGPAPAAPVFELTPWAKRVGSAFIDGGIYFVIAYFGVVITGDTSGAFPLLFNIFGLAFGIWNLVRQGKTGQSIGKSALHTKLVREEDAQPVGVGVSIGRAFLHLLDFWACFVGFLWPLWDAKRQTFADKLVRTVVIEVP